MELEFFLPGTDYLNEGENPKKKVINLFGKTNEEETVIATDRDFSSYFYCMSEKDAGTGFYIDNQVVPACLRILQVFNVDEKELKGKGNQESVGRFTG